MNGCPAGLDSRYIDDEVRRLLVLGDQEPVQSQLPLLAPDWLWPGMTAILSNNFNTQSPVGGLEMSRQDMYLSPH